MSVKIKYRGRSGNNLIQYLAAKLFCEKHSLELETPPICDGAFFTKGYNFGSPWGLEGNQGANTSNKPEITLTDENFLDFLNSPTQQIQENSYIMYGFFQGKGVLPANCEKVRDYFKLTYDHQPRDHVFVACRLGDMQNSAHMLPLEYYQTALRRLKFTKGFITSDTLSHPNVISLQEEFGLVPYDNGDPMKKIDFAKNFKQIILSEGSFSFLMGFLTMGARIICPGRPTRWSSIHKHMSHLKWEGLDIDWAPHCVGPNNELLCGELAIKK